MEYSEHNQDELRQLLTRQHRDDVAELIEQGRWPPPWMGADYVIKKDEGALLSAIADNCGLPWSDKQPALCKALADMIGMPTIGHAKTTVERCIKLGYIRARLDRDMGYIMLDLKQLGSSMLELWEDDQEEST